MTVEWEHSRIHGLDSQPHQDSSSQSLDDRTNAFPNIINQECPKRWTTISGADDFTPNTCDSTNQLINSPSWVSSGCVRVWKTLQCAAGTPGSGLCYVFVTYRCFVCCHWNIIHLVDVVVQFLLRVGEEDELTQVLPGLLGWQCWGWPIYTFWRANLKINRPKERNRSIQCFAITVCDSLKDILFFE